MNISGLTDLNGDGKVSFIDLMIRDNGLTDLDENGKIDMVDVAINIIINKQDMDIEFDPDPTPEQPISPQPDPILQNPIAPLPDPILQNPIAPLPYLDLPSLILAESFNQFDKNQGGEDGFIGSSYRDTTSFVDPLDTTAIEGGILNNLFAKVEGGVDTMLGYPNGTGDRYTFNEIGKALAGEDGKISKEEYLSLDTDGSGQISKAEIDAFKNSAGITNVTTNIITTDDLTNPSKIYLTKDSVRGSISQAYDGKGGRTTVLEGWSNVTIDGTEGDNNYYIKDSDNITLNTGDGNDNVYLENVHNSNIYLGDGDDAYGSDSLSQENVIDLGSGNDGGDVVLPGIDLPDPTPAPQPVLPIAINKAFNVFDTNQDGYMQEAVNFSEDQIEDFNNTSRNILDGLYDKTLSYYITDADSPVHDPNNRSYEYQLNDKGQALAGEDGKISKEELMSLDTDGNGLISKKEIDSYGESITFPPGESITINPAKQFEVTRRLDANGDGKIDFVDSYMRYTATPTSFGSSVVYDQNNDGKYDEQDVFLKWNQSAYRGNDDNSIDKIRYYNNHFTGIDFTKKDVNGDGTVNIADKMLLSTMKENPTADVYSLLQSMDSNGDEKISSREVYNSFYYDHTPVDYYTPVDYDKPVDHTPVYYTSVDYSQEVSINATTEAIQEVITDSEEVIYDSEEAIS